MPSETRYCQNDSHTINTITANKLLTSNTSSGTYFGTSGSAGITSMLFSLYSVERVQADGTITTIATGTPTGDGLANTTRTEEGEGIQSATWNCPETALDTTDAIRIRLRARRVTPSSNSAYEYFITDQLGAYQLDAETWTQYLYSWWYNSSSADYARIRYGSSTYSTRITGFSYSVTVAPTVTTSSVSNITHNTAQANGNITVTGGENCDERGFVYGTTTQSNPGNTAPTSSGYDSYKNETGTYSTGAFNLTLSSLSANTTYYVRAYAHNSAGYSYGSEVSFRTNLFESLGIATINALALPLTDDVAYFETLGVAAAVARATKITELILNPVIMTTCYPQSINGSNLTLRGVANGAGITTRGFLIWTEDWDYPPEV